MDCATPTAAASWITTSTPSSARRTSSASRTSPRRYSALRFACGGQSASAPWTCASRLSSTRTFWPSATSASTRCEPMKPAPPVTRIFMRPPPYWIGRRSRRREPRRRRLAGAVPGKDLAVLLRPPPSEHRAHQDLRHHDRAQRQIHGARAVLAEEDVPAAVVLDARAQRELLLRRLAVQVDHVRVGQVKHSPASAAHAMTPVGFLEEEEVVLVD